MKATAIIREVGRIMYLDVYRNKYGQSLVDRLAQLKNDYGIDINHDLCWELGDKQELIDLCNEYDI